MVDFPSLGAQPDDHARFSTEDVKKHTANPLTNIKKSDEKEMELVSAEFLEACCTNVVKLNEAFGALPSERLVPVSVKLSEALGNCLLGFATLAGWIKDHPNERINGTTWILSKTQFRHALDKFEAVAKEVLGEQRGK